VRGASDHASPDDHGADGHVLAVLLLAEEQAVGLLVRDIGDLALPRDLEALPRAVAHVLRVPDAVDTVLVLARLPDLGVSASLSASGRPLGRLSKAGCGDQGKGQGGGGDEAFHVVLLVSMLIWILYHAQLPEVKERFKLRRRPIISRRMPAYHPACHGPRTISTPRGRWVRADTRPWGPGGPFGREISSPRRSPRVRRRSAPSRRC